MNVNVMLRSAVQRFSNTWHESFFLFRGSIAEGLCCRTNVGLHWNALMSESTFTPINKKQELHQATFHTNSIKTILIVWLHQEASLNFYTCDPTSLNSGEGMTRTLVSHTHNLLSEPVGWSIWPQGMLIAHNRKPIVMVNACYSR